MNHSKLIVAKRIAVAVAAVCATLSAPAFAADNAKNLLDLMLKKGVITQAEYDDYLKSDAYENEQFKQKRTDDDLGKAAKYVQKHEKDGNVTENGLGLMSADGQHRLNLEGRIHYDFRTFNGDFADQSRYDANMAKQGDGFEVRRARIGVNGYIFKDIGFKILTNTLGSDANLIDEAWLNFGYVKEAQVRIGRFKQQNNLEELTSSNNIDFMERSYVNQFAPGKKLGVMLHGVPYAGVVYGASMYQNGYSQISSKGSMESSARVALNIAEIAGLQNQIIHLGYSATAGDFEVALSSTAAVATIRSEDRGIDAYRFQMKADGLGVINKKIQGLEAVYGYGPFKLQTEYSQVDLSATDAVTNNGGGAQVEASGKIKTNYIAALYNLTGESWSGAYKEGAFSSLKPKSNFKLGGGGTGLWQIGIRVSEFDATDLAVVTGGATTPISGSPKGRTVTYGLTWFMNPNARIMLNIADTKFDTAFRPFSSSGVAVSNTTAGSSERVFSVRTQFNF